MLKHNKRGLVFGLYLIVLTILMIGLVIVLYLNQQKNVNSQLVSPVDVLEARDNLTIFELREDQIAKEVSKEVGITDTKKFKDLFLSKLESNDKMKEFLLANLTIDGNEFEVLDYNNFLENKVYRNFELKDGWMTIERSKIGKKFKLNTLKRDEEIRFPVTFYFEYERKFKLNKEGEIY